MAEEAKKSRSGCGWWAALGGAAAAGLLIWAFSAVDTPAPSGAALAQAERDALPVDSEELNAAYEENEVAAEARFGARPVIVTGPVASIGRNDIGEPFIGLGELTAVAVLLDRDGEAAVARLKRGDTARVLCTEVRRMEVGLRLDGCVLR